MDPYMKTAKPASHGAKGLTPKPAAKTMKGFGAKKKMKK